MDNDSDALDGVSGMAGLGIGRPPRVCEKAVDRVFAEALGPC
jgi:hypothetical protein